MLLRSGENQKGTGIEYRVKSVGACYNVWNRQDVKVWNGFNLSGVHFWWRSVTSNAMDPGVSQA